MNEKYYSLKTEKQDRMINGAMQVFAQNGYHYASTDEMVRVSGVSKGLWFHYFDNKPGLYAFVASYALKYALLEFKMRPAPEGGDYFALRYDIEACKVQMVQKYPYLPLFLYRIAREQDPDVEAQLREPRQRYAAQMREMMLAADMSLLKKSASYLLLIDMLDYTIEALLVDGYRAPVFSGERYLAEVKKHIEALEQLLQGA